MRHELHAAVEDAYEIFGDYRIRHALSVCHCNSCMSVEHERALLKTTLREIPAGLLAEYTGSAHSWDDGPVAREMRYFLPRYFDLIAQNDPPDNCGIDVCLRRLAQADWRAKWPERECAIIDRFFAELMRDCVERTELVRWPVGWRLAFDLADVLTLVVTAHGDIDNVLAVWDAAPDPGAALHIAALREDVLHHTARMHFHSPYLDEFPQAADKIGAFLMRPQTIPRIEAAFFMVTDPRLQQLLSDAIYLD